MTDKLVASMIGDKMPEEEQIHWLPWWENHCY